MRRLVYGSLAGLAATLPMTAAMGRLHRRLPENQRYALPPREIVAAAGGPERPGATLLAHFGYGALTGALFALQPRRSPLVGAGFGVAVWAASYLGWIPALGLLAPATRHPARRNALMLAAHLAWGSALASGCARSRPRSAPSPVEAGRCATCRNRRRSMTGRVLWAEEADGRRWPPLGGDVETDVAVRAGAAGGEPRRLAVRRPGAHQPPRLLVATGFDAWGITTGVVAARVLADTVQGRAHPLAEALDATRIRPAKGATTFVSENVRSGVAMVRDRVLGMRTGELDAIAPGSGGVVKHGDRQVAVSRSRLGPS